MTDSPHTISKFKQYSSTLLLNTAAMVSLKLFFAGFQLVFVCVSGQVYRPGGCPNVTKVIVDYDKVIIGRWYTISHYPEYHPSLYYTRCPSEIKEKTKNGTYIVKASFEMMANCTFVKDFKVTEIFLDENEPGVTTSVGILDNLPNYRYQVLDIDYNSHRILYGCVENGPEKAWSLQYLSIFSRSPQPLKKCLMDKLYAILEKNDIIPDFLVPIDHYGCPKIEDKE